MGKVLFSLVLPAYNEKTKIGAAVRAATKALGGIHSEIIIAEDGSTDGTAQEAARLAKKYPRVRVLHSEKKLGRGRALCNAFHNSRGKYVGYMDVDLATSPRHLREMVALLGQYDIVIGSRYAPGNSSSRSFSRLFLSRGFNKLVGILLGSGLADHQCGFKAFRKGTALQLCGLAREKHWFWDTEVLVLAQQRGMKIKELAVEWREDMHGHTKVDFKRDIADMGIAAIKMRLRKG